MKTWTSRLQEVYSSREEWAAYADTYGLAERIGMTIDEAWDANPLVGGSVNPADFGLVRLRTIQCPLCLSYMQGDFPPIAALPNHKASFLPDYEMRPVESRTDPDLCPASEQLVETQPSEKGQP